MSIAQPYFIVAMIVGIAIALIAAALFALAMRWLDSKEARKKLLNDNRKLVRDLRAAQDSIAFQKAQNKPYRDACESARQYIWSVPKRYKNPDPSSVLDELDRALDANVSTDRFPRQYVQQFAENNLADGFTRLKREMRETLHGEDEYERA
jgi:hypothetical protein